MGPAGRIVAGLALGALQATAAEALATLSISGSLSDGDAVFRGGILFDETTPLAPDGRTFENAVLSLDFIVSGLGASDLRYAETGPGDIVVSNTGLVDAVRFLVPVQGTPVGGTCPGSFECVAGELNLRLTAGPDLYPLLGPVTLEALIGQDKTSFDSGSRSDAGTVDGSIPTPFNPRDFEEPSSFAVSRVPGPAALPLLATAAAALGLAARRRRAAAGG